MGASLAGAGDGGGRRRRRGRRHAPVAEINMTPFIDVVLVLLIVFMVAAPLLTAGVPLDLPQTGAKQLNIDRKPITVSIDDRGRLFLMDAAVPEGELVERLKVVTREGYDERVYVRGHKAVDYGRVAKVMSLVTSAGFKRVALVTEPDGKV